MARTKNIEEPKELTVSAPESQLGKYLNANSEDHFNFEKEAERYVISSGSLNLDSEIGGFVSGCQRIAGGPGLGKTPFLLNVVDNFLDTVPHSRAIWCKAEGRLSDKNIARCRHRIVSNAAEWVDGTIFVFECNVYETWIGLMRDFIVNNPTGTRYCFVTDSLDNMGLKNDLVKPLNESSRVAGVPVLTKDMFRKIGLAMNKRGHLCFFITQRTADIKIDPYAPAQARQVAGSGGNSVAHNANEALEFRESYEGDLILQNPDKRPDRLTNRPIGHYAKVTIRKSDSENRFITIDIPIKHGVEKGNAIWREREIGDQLLSWGLLTKSASWLVFTDVLKKELADAALKDVPEKIQGLNQLYAFLESRQDVVDYLFDKFKKMIGSKN